MLNIRSPKRIVKTIYVDNNYNIEDVANMCIDKYGMWSSYGAIRKTSKRFYDKDGNGLFTIVERDLNPILDIFASYYHSIGYSIIDYLNFAVYPETKRLKIPKIPKDYNTHNIVFYHYISKIILMTKSHIIEYGNSEMLVPILKGMCEYIYSSNYVGIPKAQRVEIERCADFLCDIFGHKKCLYGSYAKNNYIVIDYRNDVKLYTVKSIGTEVDVAIELFGETSYSSYGRQDAYIDNYIEYTSFYDSNRKLLFKIFDASNMPLLDMFRYIKGKKNDSNSINRYLSHNYYERFGICINGIWTMFDTSAFNYNE